MTIYVVVRENQDDPSDLLKAYFLKRDAEAHARRLNGRTAFGDVVVKAVDLE